MGAALAALRMRTWLGVEKMKPKAPLTTIITPIAMGSRITSSVIDESDGVEEEDDDERRHQLPVGEAAADEDAGHRAGAAEQQVDRDERRDRAR